jgi:hypothetical protein
MRFNIIFLFSSSLRASSFLFAFAIYISRSSRPRRYLHPNIIRWRVQIMKLIHYVIFSFPLLLQLSYRLCLSAVTLFPWYQSWEPRFHTRIEQCLKWYFCVRVLKLSLWWYVKSRSFCVVTPCGVVVGYRRFGGGWCFHLQVWSGDTGNKVLRNLVILPRHYTASQRRRRGLLCILMFSFFWQNTEHISYVCVHTHTRIQICDTYLRNWHEGWHSTGFWFVDSRGDH